MDDYRSVFTTSQDGLKLHARDYGDRASPRLPVVCLAGLTRNAVDFHDLALALSRHRHRPRRVVAIDLRGRGLSDHDPDWRKYEPRIEVADVMDQLAALGVAHAVFVGTSRGGLIAMGLAAARPGLLKGVVLNDIGPVIEAQGLIRIRSYVGKLPAPRGMDEAVDILRRISDARFPALSDDDWLAMARGSWTEKNGALVPSYDTSLFRGLAALDLEAPLPPIWPYFKALAGVPVLAIRGENSDLLSEATLDAMAAAHPGLEPLTVPGQGHAPLLRDAATIGRITSFVGHVEDGAEVRSRPATGREGQGPEPAAADPTTAA
ncbi:MAG: alpha/beta fold hydrolase [Alsobacter sp.]